MLGLGVKWTWCYLTTPWIYDFWECGLNVGLLNQWKNCKWSKSKLTCLNSKLKKALLAFLNPHHCCSDCHWVSTHWKCCSAIHWLRQVTAATRVNSQHLGTIGRLGRGVMSFFIFFYLHWNEKLFPQSTPLMFNT